MTNDSLASHVFVEAEQAELIRFFQGTPRFIDRLPGNDASRSALPGVQRPGLDVAIRLMDVIRCPINPRFQTVTLHAVGYQTTVILEGR